MTLWQTLLVQGVFWFLAVLALAWWLKRRQQQSSDDSGLERRLEYALQQWQQSQLEVEELRSGIIGVGQRVLQLESSLKQLQEDVQQQLSALHEQQQALSLTDPDTKMYSRAMKMVQLGADLDEIMRECELPRAEAELLYNLHQAKQ